LFLRDQGPTEIGGFGIAREGDPLFIEDIAVIQQCCTPVTVRFDDLAVADFFDRQIDLGRRPEEFARIWLHTHPGDSAQPSLTDEKTFSRVFGKCDWALMFILARGGQSYARLRFNSGPKADVEIQTEVDWSKPFAGSDQASWFEEYKANISEEVSLLTPSPTRPSLYDELSRWDEKDFAAAFW
jgi:proteasome lid subunit RPN8/RPN11